MAESLTITVSASGVWCACWLATLLVVIDGNLVPFVCYSIYVSEEVVMCGNMVNGASLHYTRLHGPKCVLINGDDSTFVCLYVWSIRQAKLWVER